MRPAAILSLIALSAACGEPRGSVPGPEPSAAVQAPAEPVPARREGILFAVSAEDSGGARLDVIAIVTPGGLRDPWDMPEDSSFNARYYAPGTRYALRVKGVPAGEVAVIAAEEPGCYDHLARAAATLARPLPARWTGLASDVFGAAPREPLLRAATDAEKAILAALADSVHAARGVAGERRRTARMDGLFAATLPGNAEPVLIGSSSISYERDGFEQVHAVMVVADGYGGAYRPAYVWYESGLEADMQRRVLLDALDVDGDGRPELIAETTYYESWNYTVLQRTREDWSEIYHGGGGGC